MIIYYLHFFLILLHRGKTGIQNSNIPIEMEKFWDYEIKQISTGENHCQKKLFLFFYLLIFIFLFQNLLNLNLGLLLCGKNTMYTWG